MPRLKPKYSQPTAPVLTPSDSEPLRFSFDLDGAAKYVSFSVSVIRGAVRSGELHVVNDKPITVLRSDLERWVESRRHRYVPLVLKKQKAAA